MKVKIKDFFPPKPDLSPTIYAYELEGVTTHKRLLKIGYTTRKSKDRVGEQLKTSRVKYKIVFEESAMRNDGSAFTDFDVHRCLRRKGIKWIEGEWFKCTVNDLKSTIIEIKSGTRNEDNRTLNYEMRPEQEEAVRRASEYFSSFKEEKRTPHFLWNCKMLIGKILAAYLLA